MNRYIRVRPVLFLIFIIFGIIILIYAAATTFTTVDSDSSGKAVQPDSGVISGGRAPELISENEEEDGTAPSMQENNSLPALSRGETGRTVPAASGVKEAAPAVSEAGTAASAEAKAIAPATPAKATAAAQSAATGRRAKSRIKSGGHSCPERSCRPDLTI